MKITPLPASELTAEMLSIADQWQTSRPTHLGTAFLSTAFLRHVAEIRRDTWVAWIEDDLGAPAGLFAFHRRTGGVGIPLAAHLSDYQAIVSARPLELDPARFLCACRLELFDFDHLLPGSFASSSVFSTALSPWVDVTRGYEALASELRSRGSAWTTVQRHRRRMEKELGPLRFEWNVTSEQVWRKLWEWKRGQYRATRVRDVLEPGWTRALFERLRTAREPAMTGVCSALWAGEELMAAHFGMWSHGALHYWFPAYAPEHGRYGAGLVLLDELARGVADRAGRHVDLGKGDQRYKLEWGTGQETVLEGSITRGGPVTVWRGLRSRARAWVRNSWVGEGVRAWRQRRKR